VINLYNYGKIATAKNSGELKTPTTYNKNPHVKSLHGVSMAILVNTKKFFAFVF
jgi:hypothetical protein